MSAVPAGIDLSLVPLYPNPDGAPSNFTDPVSLKPTILGVGIMMIIISTAFTALRVFTSIRTPRKLGADDGLCVFALIGSITYWVLIYSMARDGAASHSWDVPASVITPSLMKASLRYSNKTHHCRLRGFELTSPSVEPQQHQVASEIIAGPTKWAAKAAIMVFYLRLFGTQTWLRRTCYGLLIFSFLCYWSNAVIGFVFCLPHGDAEGWNAALLLKCAEPVVSTVIIGVGSVVIDLILFVIPFPIIARLNLKSSTKRGLVILFLFGFLINVTGLAGLVYRVVVYRGTDDPIWEGMNVAITSFVEDFGTISVSCGPALSSFWFNIFIKTKFYESIVSYSGLRSSRTRTRTAAATSTANHIGPYHGEAQCRRSSKSLVGGDIESTPLDSIHKKTSITQESFSMAERQDWQYHPDMHTYTSLPGV